MGSAALLLGISLSVWAGPLVGHAMAWPAAAEPVPLPGFYECQGTGADGRVYRGAVIIEPDGKSGSHRTLSRTGWPIDSWFSGTSPRNSRPWGSVFATETCLP